eukprot:4113242-Alexandrium_andersonii.AAC.1
MGLPGAGQEEHDADRAAPNLDVTNSLDLLRIRLSLVLVEVVVVGVQPKGVEVGVQGSPGAELRPDARGVLLAVDVLEGGGLRHARLIDGHVMLPEVLDLPRPKLLAITWCRGGVAVE